MQRIVALRLKNFLAYGYLVETTLEFLDTYLEFVACAYLAEGVHNFLKPTFGLIVYGHLVEGVVRFPSTYL